MRAQSSATMRAFASALARASQRSMPKPFGLAADDGDDAEAPLAGQRADELTPPSSRR